MARDLQGGGGAARRPEPGPRPRLRQPWVITRATALWLCCPSVTEAVVHYDGVRTLGCRVWLGEATCAGCDAGHVRRRQFWTQAQDYDLLNTARMLSLTPGCVEGCPGLADPTRDLWGMLLRVRRWPETRYGAMSARLDFRADVPAIAQCRDTLSVLKEMWAADLRRNYQGGPRIFQPPPPVDPLTEGL